MDGVFYIASGKRYIYEAVQSIKRVREVMPNIPIALCSDIELNKDIDVDYYIKLESPRYNFADKVCNYAKSPFDNTLFLDTDTYLVDSVESIFDLLKRFDIAAPHAPIEEDDYVDITDAFPEMNSGVIAYKKNSATDLFFDIYERHYLHSLKSEMKKYNLVPPDQPSFRYALFYSNVTLSFLPHEYNCMVDYPCFLSNRVHILHGHYSIEEMKTKEKIINEETDCRLYSPSLGMIYER